MSHVRIVVTLEWKIWLFISLLDVFVHLWPNSWFCLFYDLLPNNLSANVLFTVFLSPPQATSLHGSPQNRYDWLKRNFGCVLGFSPLIRYLKALYILFPKSQTFWGSTILLTFCLSVKDFYVFFVRRGQVEDKNKKKCLVYVTVSNRVLKPPGWVGTGSWMNCWDAQKTMYRNYFYILYCAGYFIWKILAFICASFLHLSSKPTS